MYRRNNSTFSCREILIERIHWGRNYGKRKYKVFIDVEGRNELYSQEFLDYVERVCNVKIVNHEIKKDRWNYDLCTTSIDIENASYEEISLATWLLSERGGIFDKVGKELITELLEKRLIYEYPRWEGPWSNRVQVGTKKEMNYVTLFTVFGLYLKENGIEIVSHNYTSGIMNSIYNSYDKYISLFSDFVKEFNLEKNIKETVKYTSGATTRFISPILKGE